MVTICSVWGAYLEEQEKSFARLSWAQILVLILWFETCEDHSLGRKQTDLLELTYMHLHQSAYTIQKDKNGSIYCLSVLNGLKPFLFS